MIRFVCDDCGCRIKARDESAGHKSKCPKCSHHLIIPSSQEATLMKDSSGTDCNSRPISGLVVSLDNNQVPATAETKKLKKRVSGATHFYRILFVLSLVWVLICIYIMTVTFDIGRVGWNVLSIITLSLGICVIILCHLACKATRRGEKWATNTMLVLSIFGTGGFLLTAFILSLNNLDRVGIIFACMATFPAIVAIISYDARAATLKLIRINPPGFTFRQSFFEMENKPIASLKDVAVIRFIKFGLNDPSEFFKTFFAYLILAPAACAGIAIFWNLFSKGGVNPETAIAKGIAVGIVGGFLYGIKEANHNSIAAVAKEKSGDLNAFPILTQAFKSQNLPILIKALMHGKPFVRLAAVKLLGRLGANALPSVPVLMRTVPEKVPATFRPKVGGGEFKSRRVCVYCGTKLSIADFFQ